MVQTPPRNRQPHRARRVGLGALWVIALLGSWLVAGEVVEDSEAVESALFAVGRRLRTTAWVWPLAAAVAITVVTGPLVRDRWRTPIRPLKLGSIVFVVLGGLIVAVGPLQALLVLAVAAVVGLLAAWVVVLPRRLAPPLPTETLERLSDRDRLELADARVKLQNDLRTTALQAVAGLAVLAGAFLGFQQLTEDRQQATAARELTLQGQASERFTRAIDQLGSDRLEVQLGGIYGLEQIAQQAPDNRAAVTQVLVAYLHRRSPRPANAPTQPAQPQPLRVRAPEVQAALTVLGRRWPVSRPDPPLDLSNLDLRGAIIQAGYIIVDPAARPELWYANLNGADLRGTDLRGAVFLGVELVGAHFDGADLRGANLELAAFPAVGMHAEHLDAELKDADLRGALADGSTRWPEGFDWRAEGVEMG
jgi:Pentapeptide repeats (8 copies)